MNHTDRGYIEDTFFLLLGVATLGTYGGLLVQGTAPEQALALAAGGGLGAAIIARTAVRWIASFAAESREPSKGQHLDVAVGEDAPPKPSQP
ncbi:MAG TPA: hypothetical protein VIN09_03530 [Chloroflexota bacterium]